MKRILVALFAIAAFALGISGANAGTVIGPILPYFGIAQSPFNGLPFSYFFLETFESGSLTVPGVTISPSTTIGTGPLFDSVEGPGDLGHSLFSGSGAAGLGLPSRQLRSRHRLRRRSPERPGTENRISQPCHSRSPTLRATDAGNGGCTAAKGRQAALRAPPAGRVVDACLAHRRGSGAAGPRSGAAAPGRATGRRRDTRRPSGPR